MQDKDICLSVTITPNKTKSLFLLITDAAVRIKQLTYAQLPTA